MLARNHLLCPYADCIANKRTGSQRIRVLLDEERNVELQQSSWKAPAKTKLSYKYQLWEKPSKCPFCGRPVEVVIDEIHKGRNINIRLPTKPLLQSKETRVTKNQSSPQEKTLSREEILSWNSKYDEDYPWWNIEEKELGNKIRGTQKLTKTDLVRIVEWKFKTFPGRKSRILKLISRNTEEDIELISSKALKVDSDSDLFKMETLCRLKGVGPALASTILTFYDPTHYGVFDIHVCQEFFGKIQIVPPTITTYLNILEKLRRIAKQCDLEVRAVEKAFFKRNIDR
jgi:hypothetical protein